ncbi:hypothetical protein PV10_07108 [Exophiala mesophila]|uniref:Uncharacterized protein n=1 Tax=Exophiala mesophila TaxID=212818 RepID=A0A0D1ZSD7_EXOME|nr:uncharacterized protein PV10_07108 [Exophiala mesophila]KIV89728.1 hypothetical protein PV10_07108 [Exophiala mesophila]
MSQQPDRRKDIRRSQENPDDSRSQHSDQSNPLQARGLATNPLDIPMSRPSTRAESDYYIKYPKREKSYERVRPQPQQDPTVVQYEKGHVTIVNNHSHFPGHYGADQQDFTTERGTGNYDDELDAPLHLELEGERYNDAKRRDLTSFDERSSGPPPDDDEPIRGRQPERREYGYRDRRRRSPPRDDPQGLNSRNR